MKKENSDNKLEGKSFGAIGPILFLLQQNNALLTSIADLIIKTSAKDKKHLKELTEYFSKRCEINDNLSSMNFLKMFVRFEKAEKKEKKDEFLN